LGVVKRFVYVLVEHTHSLEKLVLVRILTMALEHVALQAVGVAHEFLARVVTADGCAAVVVPAGAPTSAASATHVRPRALLPPDEFGSALTGLLAGVGSLIVEVEVMGCPNDP
jgi:hypothetical protein